MRALTRVLLAATATVRGGRGDCGAEGHAGGDGGGGCEDGEALGVHGVSSETSGWLMGQPSPDARAVRYWTVVLAQPTHPDVSLL